MIILCVLALGAAPLSAQEHVDRLIAVLKADGKLEEKHAACRELAALGNERAVPALAAMLGDDKLSQPARNALENIPGPKADEALRAALAKLKGPPRVGVINSIGARRDARAVGALAGLLADADPEAAASAAISLGKIGTPEAAAALKGALAGASPAVAAACLACADAAMGRKNADEARALYDLVRASGAPDSLRAAGLCGALIARGASGADLLREQLRGGDAAMFAAALRAAHEIAGSEVTRALAGELGKLPAERQVLVLHALGDRRDGAAVPAILELSKNAAPEACVTVLGVLTQIGDVSALPRLVEWMSSADAAAARSARTAVAAFPSKEADAAVAALLARGDPKTRVIAIQLAGQRRVAGALPSLLESAADADAPVRAASLKVLGELGGARELPALLDLLAKARSPEDLEGLETALSAICRRQADREASAGRVADCFAAAQGGARLAALRVLRSLGGARALAVVRAAAADAALKDEALRMVCDWPTTEALPDVTELARKSTDAKLKILALRACLRLIPLQEASVERKLAGLKDALSLVERPDEKKLALAALAETPHPEAGRIIESALGEAAVRAEAETALLRVGQLLAGTHPDEAKAFLEKVAASAADRNLKKQAQRLIQQMGKEGWKELFNGRDLAGWDGAPGWWRVEDGALTAQSTAEKPCKQCTYLVWKDGAPGDFELAADFRLSAEGNSGIQIRSERRPNWDTFGYQADMTGDGKLAGFVYHHKRGLIAGRGQSVAIGADGRKEEQAIGDPAELLKAFRKEDWNTYRIVCRGPEIALHVNGVMMCRFTDQDKASAAASGIIALQMHPGPPMKVQFRNIRLKELGK